MYKPLKKKIVSVLVKNEANVLTRVVMMFGRRGFNIDSLTVSATNDPTLSRVRQSSRCSRSLHRLRNLKS